MSQNFSTMSDIYIPELMELDSYWQKAVEDAIYDTLKGEKRLHHALRNRKKINQKLEKLGLKRVPSRLDFSRHSFNRREPEDENDKSNSDQFWEGASRELVDSDKSRSRTFSKGDSPFRKNEKSSERPLLGNGSLEKMKKSQNSFNFEPMGMDSFEEDTSDLDDLDFNASGVGKELKNKKIRWLHVRNERDFENSDGDSVIREEAANGDFHKEKSLKDRNYFLKSSSALRFQMGSKEKKKPLKIQKLFEWDHAIRGNSNLDRKLHVALAKRDILNKKLRTSSMGVSTTKMRVNRSGVKLVERKRRGKRHLSPFVCFYLEVYRELCHKLPVRRITEEAAKRWRAMSAKEKAQYNKLHRK